MQFHKLKNGIVGTQHIQYKYNCNKVIHSIELKTFMFKMIVD